MTSNTLRGVVHCPCSLNMDSTGREQHMEEWNTVSCPVPLRVQQLHLFYGQSRSNHLPRPFPSHVRQEATQGYYSNLVVGFPIGRKPGHREHGSDEKAGRGCSTAAQSRNCQVTYSTRERSASTLKELGMLHEC